MFFVIDLLINLDYNCKNYIKDFLHKLFIIDDFVVR